MAGHPSLNNGFSQEDISRIIGTPENNGMDWEAQSRKRNSDVVDLIDFGDNVNLKKSNMSKKKKELQSANNS